MAGSNTSKLDKNTELKLNKVFHRWTFVPSSLPYILYTPPEGYFIIFGLSFKRIIKNVSYFSIFQRFVGVQVEWFISEEWNLESL